MNQAIDYLDCKDKPYRVELMNTKIVDEPTYYNLKSVCMFGSTVSAELVDMMHDLGYYTGANEFLFDGGNTVSIPCLESSICCSGKGNTTILTSII